MTGTVVPKVKGLTTEQSEAMVRLSRLPVFKDLVAKVQADEVRQKTKSNESKSHLGLLNIENFFV